MNDFESRFERRPVRTSIGAGARVLLVFFVLSILAGVGWLVTQPFRTATGIVSRTLNPDSVLYNYEWFKRQVQDVGAMDERLRAARLAQKSFEAAAGSRDSWKFDDRQEWNRLNAVVLGLEGQRAAMVAEYNARTQMANRDLFRTGDLPESLN
jgi:hypothetical protein